AMRSAMRAQDETRPITRATLKRIAGFAKRHQRRLILFVIASIITAVLAVATPVLAGRVVDAIVDGESEDVVIRLAALIAGIALMEAALGLFSRWLSASIGEGLIFDLRTAVYNHV